MTKAVRLWRLDGKGGRASDHSPRSSLSTAARGFFGVGAVREFVFLAFVVDGRAVPQVDELWGSGDFGAAGGRPSPGAGTNPGRPGPRTSGLADVACHVHLTKCSLPLLTSRRSGTVRRAVTVEAVRTPFGRGRQARVLHSAHPVDFLAGTVEALLSTEEFEGPLRHRPGEGARPRLRIVGHRLISRPVTAPQGGESPRGF